MAPGGVIHLAVVDGSRVLADALGLRLDCEPDMHVVRCAASAHALGQVLVNRSVDVVVGDAALLDPADLDPPVRSGHGPAVLLLADDEDGPRMVAAIRGGVQAWVPRRVAIEDLVHVVRTVAGGGTWIPPLLLTELLHTLVWSSPEDDPEHALLATLTPREREVLSCLAEGLDRRGVADRLGMSTNTARTHVQSILTKLHVTSAVAAVAVLRRAVPAGGPATRRTPPERVRR